MKTVAAKLSLQGPSAFVQRSAMPTEREIRIRQFEMILRNELRRKSAQRC